MGSEEGVVTGGLLRPPPPWLTSSARDKGCEGGWNDTPFMDFARVLMTKASI